MVNSYEQGGITGGNELRKKALVDSLSAPPLDAGMPALDTGAPPPDLAPPAAAPAQQYALKGFDAGKLADTSHNTPKYQLGRTLQGFDPNQGVTPEALAALNKLGIGTFSGNGDHLSVANGSKDFNGMTDWDGIKDLHSGGNAAWQFGVDSNLDSGSAELPQQAPQMMQGQPVDSLLSGDPMAAIQAAISQQAGNGGKNALQQIMASLRGGK